MKQSLTAQRSSGPAKSDAAQQREKFAHLIPYENALLRTDEAGECLGFKRDVIYTLILEGKLEAHADEDGEKPHYRVTRRSVLARLAKTAKYDPDDFLDVIESLSKTLSGPQIARLLVRLQLVHQTK